MKQNWSIDELQEAWELVSQLHEGQKFYGRKEGDEVAYIHHIGSVTFEILNAISNSENINSNLAIKCALLHDSIEDTDFSYENVKNKFGKEVADGVLALTKNEKLNSKDEMMADSLQRIKQQPKEIWAVKMADRISNLSPPPFYWTNEKKIFYINEAKLIHQELKDGNQYLANRLAKKINDYQNFIQ